MTVADIPPIEPAAHVEETGPLSPAAFAERVAAVYRPVVMRGLVADWPAVAAARKGVDATAAYLARFDRGGTVSALVAPPSAHTRFFYDEGMTGLNCERRTLPLAALLAELLHWRGRTDAPALYAGAAAAGDLLPGWTDANPLPLPTPGAVPRVWIGNRSHVSTHFDASSNIACAVAGRRRVTLFPPDRIADLYVGPIDMTVAGQPTSMVDLSAPDLARYPRFAAALAAAEMVDLEPGDALYIPALWWHDVQATGDLNILVNYWWSGGAAAQPGAQPLPALAHAMLAFRDLPAPVRAAWRGWFDHYVFGDDATAAGDHLPLHARGPLGPLTPERAAGLRRYIAGTLR